MGSGYGANYADVVDQSFVQKQVGKKLLDKFWKLVNPIDDGSFPYEFFQYEYVDASADPNHEYHEIAVVYNTICNTFEAKTGLSLELAYHDSDNNGDRYDEVEGYFWCVGGVWELTPAGKKFKNKIERKMYVTYG